MVHSLVESSPSAFYFYSSRLDESEPVKKALSLKKEGSLLLYFLNALKIEGKRKSLFTDSKSSERAEKEEEDSKSLVQIILPKCIQLDPKIRNGFRLRDTTYPTNILWKK